MQIYLYICFFFSTFVAQMGNIIQYIIEFLLYGNQEAANLVGYTSAESDWEKYSVVVVPNGQLGKNIVVPDLSDVYVETITQDGDERRFVIHTDIIYNIIIIV